MAKKMTKREHRSYQDIARLAHEMTCNDPKCNYPDEPDMDYLDEHTRICMGQNKMDQCQCWKKIKTVHCMKAVMAENLAAAILRAIR